MSADGGPALPADYEERLAALSLYPAWTALGALTPRKGPIRKSQTAHWRYAEVREALLRAGALAPMELAERRVLGLLNPGLAPRLATTPSTFIGLQLILPGEHAPPHRHTPAAARLVMEGSGAFTQVEGQHLPMEFGDLILTPPQHWHEHGHRGQAPMIWMDILDHPVAIPLETSYSVEAEASQPGGANVPDASQTLYTAPGLAPYRRPTQPARRYPMMRFPWSRTRAALAAMAEAAGRAEPVHLMYVNPDSGAPPLETLSMSVRLLRPGEQIDLPVRSPSMVFVLLEGAAEVQVDGETLSCEAQDTVSVPTFAEVALRNNAARQPAVLLQIDDGPLQHKLGFYEDEIVRAGFTPLSA